MYLSSSQNATLVTGVLTVQVNVMTTVTRTPVMKELATVSVHLGTMALMGSVFRAAVDVTTNRTIPVTRSLVHANVGLGGMETNVTLGQSVSQSKEPPWSVMQSLHVFSRIKMFAQFSVIFNITGSRKIFLNLQRRSHCPVMHSVCPQWRIPVQRSHGRGSALSQQTLTLATTMSMSLSTNRGPLVLGRNCSGGNILRPHPAHSPIPWLVWHRTQSMTWDWNHTEWWELPEKRLAVNQEHLQCKLKARTQHFLNLLPPPRPPPPPPPPSLSTMPPSSPFPSTIPSTIPSTFHHPLLPQQNSVANICGFDSLLYASIYSPDDIIYEPLSACRGIGPGELKCSLDCWQSPSLHRVRPGPKTPDIETCLHSDQDAIKCLLYPTNSVYSSTGLSRGMCVLLTWADPDLVTAEKSLYNVCNYYYYSVIARRLNLSLVIERGRSPWE